MSSGKYLNIPIFTGITFRVIGENLQNFFHFFSTFKCKI